MLLVVVGAGASFGCRTLSDGSPPTPPLTTGLFADDARVAHTLKNHGAARGLVAKLRRELASPSAEPLESRLAELTREEALSDVRQREILALRMYLQDLMLDATETVLGSLGGVTFYDELVSTVAAWSHESGEGVAYISFNYDLLLDEAIAHHYGMQFRDLDDYVNGPVLLLKPHGSANWRERVDIPGWDGGLVMRVAHLLERTGDFRVDRSKIPTSYAADTTAWVPTIALPIVGKTVASAPDRHLRYFESLDQRVSHVLTIGWRGREPHLYDAFKKAARSGVKISVCELNEDSASEVSETLREVFGRRVAPLEIVGGFKGLFETSGFGTRTRIESLLGAK